MLVHSLSFSCSTRPPSRCSSSCFWQYSLPSATSTPTTSPTSPTTAAAANAHAPKQRSNHSRVSSESHVHSFSFLLKSQTRHQNLLQNLLDTRAFYCQKTFADVFTYHKGCESRPALDSKANFIDDPRYSTRHHRTSNTQLLHKRRLLYSYQQLPSFHKLHDLSLPNYVSENATPVLVPR